MRRILLVLVAASLAPLAARAQGAESSWENLQQLSAGDKIVVVTRDKATHRGTFLVAADDAISMRIVKNEAGYRREEVVRVSFAGPAQRARGARRGMIIGAIAGAAVGVGILAAHRKQNTDGPWIFTAAGWVMYPALTGITGGGAGALVGAAAARPTHTVIYRAP